MIRFKLFIFLTILCACKSQNPPENPAAWKKIKLDFKQLDESGLSGSGKGKVAMNYEFCIPALKKNWLEVQKIDPSAQKTTGKGRVGCKEDQWLIIGNTHQKNYQRVLFRLASLEYVQRIEPVYWE